MECKKCGKEIKEGNLFCTYCGTPINGIKNGENKSEKNIVIIAILLIVAVLSIFLFYKFNKVDNQEENITNNNITTENSLETENKTIETAIKYIASSEENAGLYGFIRFNTDKDYIMEVGDEGSESFIKTGTYVINEDIITLTVNYDSSESEEIEVPYEEKIKILGDDSLEYTNIYNVICKFVKETAITEDNSEETVSLLEQIYEKYPELANMSDIEICYDDTNYWLLDSEGDKVYFSDLESFEVARNECSKKQEETKTSSQNNTNTISSSTKTKNTNTSSKNSNTNSDTNSQTENEVRSFKIEFHRTCLIGNYMNNEFIETLDSPLSLKVTANDETIFEDTLTNEDLNVEMDECTTSIITYTGATPPTIKIYIDGNLFKTYDSDYTDYWFYSENKDPHYLGFKEHGAG